MLRPRLRIPRIRVPQKSGRIQAPAPAVAVPAPWSQVQFRRHVSDFDRQPPPPSSSAHDAYQQQPGFAQARQQQSAFDHARQGQQQQQQRSYDNVEEQPYSGHEQLYSDHEHLYSDSVEEPPLSGEDDAQQQEPPQDQPLNIHTVRRLENHQPFYCPSMVVPPSDFLCEDAFSMAWAEYQVALLVKLNQLVQPFPSLHSKDIKDVVLNTARDPSSAALFNYASMAHNNEFFFSGIAQRPTDAAEMPQRLLDCVLASFGSVETLREEMQAIALAMFGPGFVWLVKTAEGALGMPDACLRILPTYLAGSPYPGAHWRRQKEPMPGAVGLDAAGGEDGAPRRFMTNHTYGAGRGTVPASWEDYPPGGINLQPILCLNTWEYVWLMDYNPGGKERYVEQWWKYIDWNKVYDLSGLDRSKRLSSIKI